MRVSSAGNITIHSAPIQANGFTPQDLVIGTGINNLELSVAAGGTGNIQIWGTETSANCERGDSFRNITLDLDITTLGSVFISANNNFTMTQNGSIDNSAGTEPVTIMVDNQFPFRPFIGPGRFIMDSAATIDSGGLLEIYTALQGLNSINGLLNASTFSPGALYEDTDSEMWCTYFCEPLPGNPFTIAYKDCLQIITEQAMIIIDQMLVDLHP